MPLPANPNLERRKLRRKLNQAREAAGLTQREAADSMEWSVSKLIRIENGQVRVSVNDVRGLAALYEITDPAQLEDLLEAARRSRGAGWWAKYHEVVSPSFGRYLGLEEAARGIRVYHPVVIPGHLQTRAYTTALLKPRVEDVGRLERIADLRAERQERLFHPESATMSRYVIAESSLRLNVGGAAVMREQLDLLVELNTRRQVDISVLPSSFGAHYSTLGGFVLLDFTDDADLLYLEHATGSMTEGNDTELLGNYQMCYETIAEGALRAEAASGRIVEAKKDVTGH